MPSIISYFTLVAKKQKYSFESNKNVVGLADNDSSEASSVDEQVLSLSSSNWRLVQNIKPTDQQDSPSDIERQAWYPIKEHGRDIKDFGDIYRSYMPLSHPKTSPLRTFYCCFVILSNHVDREISGIKN
eukprot:11656526-Ditylum_brightwellii.AAC.1